MKKMKLRKSIRITGFLLSLVLGFETLCGNIFFQVNAADKPASLSHIEEIKASGGVFNILEIVPDASKGSIGYYIKGQEPIANFDATLSSLKSKEERETYVSTILGTITSESSGLSEILSSYDNYPLKREDVYKEYLPWEAPARAKELALNAMESTTVTGSFTAVAQGEKGSYSTTDVSAFVPNGSGSHVQNIKYFYFSDGTDGNISDRYYYNVTFTSVTITNDNVYDFLNVPLYILEEVKDTEDSDEDGNTEEVLYSYYDLAGILNETPGFRIDTGITYYQHTVSSAPSPDYVAEDEKDTTSARNYYPELVDGNPYVPKTSGEGYFNVTQGAYTYVGLGNGSYNFDSSNPEDTYTVYYESIFYTGGFSNNQWFLKEVFDMDDDQIASSDLSISVITLAPDAAGLSAQINVSDLIIIHPGLGDNKFDKDISETQATELTNYIKSGKAFILDFRMNVSSTYANLNYENMQLYKFADGYIKNQTTPVNKNLYIPAEKIDDIDYTNIATHNFLTKFSDDQIATSYENVVEEIKYENFLRETFGNEDLLDEEKISMATCVRAIINSVGRRVQNKKTSIKVLDIEPSASGIAQISGSTLSKNTILTDAMVQNWLESGTLTDAQIDITSMSTNEFIGSVEDITEDYDLIYIGADLRGFNTTTTSGVTMANYNDNSMDGLIYSNIGDTYTVGKSLCNNNSSYYSNNIDHHYVLSGLLDRDYAAGNTFTSGGKTYTRINHETATTFRFSGNDITTVKQKQLEAFAESGRPIILADSLVGSGTAEIAARNFTVTVSAKNVSTNGTVTLQAIPAVTGSTTDDLSYSYFWYKDNALMGRSTPTIDVTAGSDSTYYCVVTAKVIGKALQGTATSNTVKLTSSGTMLVVNPASVTVTKESLVTLSYNNRTFTANVPADLKENGSTSYQWYYRKTYDNATWSNGGNDSTYTIPYQNRNTEYYVVCIVNGKYYSEYKKYIHNKTPDTITGIYYNNTATTKVPYTLTITADNENTDNNEDQNTLTATVAGVPSGKQIQYSWNKTNKPSENNWENSASYDVTSIGDYYCTVRIGRSGGTTISTYNDLKMTASYETVYTATTVSGSTESEGTIPAVAATSASVNTASVDSCSIMYATLANIIERTNVMSSSKASSEKETVLKYLNLSKPEIDLSAWPTEYTSITQLSNDDLVTNNNTLEYKFKITNDTDATPASTTYSVSLYIDSNADGRYTADEEISDLMVVEPLADGKDKRVEFYDLKANTTYKVSRELSEQITGAIPWKLYIAKNGEADAHGSKIGYTYIKPSTPKPIRVLQVRGMTNGAINLQNNTTYTGLYDQIRNVYNVTVTSIPLNTFNDDIAKDTDNNYFDDYDMVIMGFDDAYGRNTEISSLAADRVIQYIKEGKPILFTHDNTSLCAVPIDDYETTDTSGNNSGRINVSFTFGFHWGFEFNRTLRDYVGLDRYGVTDETYGGTSYQSDKESGVVASVRYDTTNGGAGLTDDEKEGLTKEGYSIAYKPNSNFQTVGETQGYTNFIMSHYGYESSNNKTQLTPKDYTVSKCDNIETTHVSQTNKGQITQFPFIVNEYLEVKTSHEQYYQLNMNHEDIVVWYCLSDTRFANNYNDTVNGYYIFNRGNVTYSGAGHTNNSVSDDEAKLFVNTMIAAYRAANSNPTVSFKTADGESTQTNLVLPVQYEQDGSSTPIAVDASYELYFAVEDPNLSPTKKVSVEFFMDATGAGTYQDEDLAPEGTTAPTVKNISSYFKDMKRKDTGVAVANGDSLISKVLYQVTLDGSVLEDLLSGSTLQRKIYIKVTTLIDEEEYIGYAELNLVKMGLLTLY